MYRKCGHWGGGLICSESFFSCLARRAAYCVPYGLALNAASLVVEPLDLVGVVGNAGRSGGFSVPMRLLLNQSKSAAIKSKRVNECVTNECVCERQIREIERAQGDERLH